MRWRAPAALAVVLALAGCGSHGSDVSHPALPQTSASSARPPVVADVATGPPEIAWWSQGLLHVRGGAIRTPMNRVLSRGGTSLAGRTSIDGSHWSIVSGHRLVPLIRSSTPYVEPVLSANGRHLAWETDVIVSTVDAYTHVERFTVHAYDVRSGASSTTTLDSTVTCCDASGAVIVLGVDDDGAVLFGKDYGRAWSWRPSQAPVVMPGMDSRDIGGVDQWPGGLSRLTTGDSTGPAAYGAVTRTGSFVRRGLIAQAWEGLWSPDGSAYVYPVFDKFGGALPVLERHDGRTTRLRVHADHILGWESQTSVLLATHERGTGDILRSVQPVRCDITTGACADAGPVLHHVVLGRANAG